MHPENADVTYEQQLIRAAENTQRLELYTHLFVILHMLIDVMGNNALQKC